MIFLADHDKFFLKFHVELPHHAAGKKVEATTFHGKVSWAFVTYKQRGKKSARGGKNSTAPSKIYLL